MPLSRIFGWSPPENEDFIDVHSSQDLLLPLQNPTFHISEPTALKVHHRSSSGNFNVTSPASSTSALSTDADSPNELQLEVSGKRGDPNWVARPRNEFILFRCDYVRKHSRDGKRVRRIPGQEAEKTLSKQAAEAWHHLPPDERLYWKEQANGERNEHARRHPDYRYRPRKGASGRRRVSRSTSNKPTASSPETSSMITPVISNQTQEMSSPVLPQSSPPLPQTTRMAPRRSSSVPELAIAVPQRLRFTESQPCPAAPPLSAPADRVSFDLGPQPYPYMPRLQSMPSIPTSHFLPSKFGSPLLTETSMHLSSSLINWNGPPVIHPAPQPSFLSSLASLSNLDTSSDASEHATDTSGSSHLHFLPNGDLWISPMSSSSSEAGTFQAASISDVGSALDTMEISRIMHEGIPMSISPSGSSSRGGKPYDLPGCGHMPNLSNFGLDPRETTTMDDMLGGAPESNPETVFTMDRDGFFNSDF